MGFLPYLTRHSLNNSSYQTLCHLRPRKASATCLSGASAGTSIVVTPAVVRARAGPIATGLLRAIVAAVASIILADFGCRRIAADVDSFADSCEAVGAVLGAGYVGAACGSLSLEDFACGGLLVVYMEIGWLCDCVGRHSLER